MQEKGLLATLARLIPYAGDTIPRLMLGVVVGIAAHMFALALPQVLRELVNGLEENLTWISCFIRLDCFYFLVPAKQFWFCCAGGLFWSLELRLRRECAIICIKN